MLRMPMGCRGCCPACVPLRVVCFWHWSTWSSEANATAVLVTDRGLRLALTSFSSLFQQLLVFAVDRHRGSESSQSLRVPIQICCRCCAKGQGGRGAVSGVPAVAAVSVLGNYCFYFRGHPMHLEHARWSRHLRSQGRPPCPCPGYLLLHVFTGMIWGHLSRIILLPMRPPSCRGCCPACVPLRGVRFWRWSTWSSEANATAVFVVDSGLRLALASFSFSLSAVWVFSPHCSFVRTSTSRMQIVGICSGSSLWPGKIAILAGANSDMLRMLCKGTWRPWSSFWRSCSCCSVCAWQILLLLPRCA